MATEKQLKRHNRPVTIATVRSIYGVREKPKYTRRKNRSAQAQGFPTALALAAHLAALMATKQAPA